MRGGCRAESGSCSVKLDFSPVFFFPKSVSGGRRLCVTFRRDLLEISRVDKTRPYYLLTSHKKKENQMCFIFIDIRSKSTRYVAITLCHLKRTTALNGDLQRFHPKINTQNLNFAIQKLVIETTKLEYRKKFFSNESRYCKGTSQKCH